MPQPSNAPVQPVEPQQDLQMPMAAGETDENPPVLSQPAPPPAQQLLQPQLEQPPPAARQTCSGRVIWNTPHNKQSISQQSKGLVAWEVLLDQDEQEDIPTAAMQYATQRALEDPIAFAASNNPDILYWDQVM